MKYKVAGIVFEVRLEEPYREMEYSPVVLDRIARASRGEAGLDIRPTRAGDDVPHRTLVQTREELLPGARGLDLSQYAPFQLDRDFSASVEMTEKQSVEMTEDQPGDCVPRRNRPHFTDGEGYSLPAFVLTVKRGLDKAPELGTLITRVQTQLPYFSIYEHEGCPRYTLDENTETGEPSAILCMSPDFKESELYVAESLRASAVVFQLSTALMMNFTYVSAQKGVLLIHASVIGYNGKANIFLGKSGTGKSTHSRLWLENIPGADLLNDDNPALGFDKDGKPCIFGTPWSGKTPCYRNICAPLNAIVRLEQAPENSIARDSGINAFAALYGSVSAIRWNRPIMDAITASVEKIASSVKVFRLSCLPDPAAAQLCCRTILEL